jgi:hypothetical protein
MAVFWPQASRLRTGEVHHASLMEARGTGASVVAQGARASEVHQASSTEARGAGTPEVH